MTKIKVSITRLAEICESDKGYTVDKPYYNGLRYAFNRSASGRIDKSIVVEFNQYGNRIETYNTPYNITILD
tara:strand:- start:228 stop:443 length:216 start_codon:yes stop_codon:yes gene_type:complete